MIQRFFVAFVGFAVCLSAVPAHADIPALPYYDLTNGGTIQGWGSLRDGGGFDAWSVLGDTYGAEPLAQDGASAFYISSAGTSPPTAIFTFDQTLKLHGTNLTGAPQPTPTDTFNVIDLQTHLGGGAYLIQTEIVSLDVTGAPVPWVAAGVTGPGGAFTSWRIDVGGLAAFADLINPDSPFTITSAGFEAFNSAGASLGAFGLTVDLSDPTGMGGVGVVGLGGPDIAGFDLASLQVFFTTIPEPGSAGVLALVGVAFFARRRRK